MKLHDYCILQRDPCAKRAAGAGITVPSRENGSFLANGTTFLTFYTSSKLEKWVFQKMGRLDDREENGTLTNLRESFVTFENRGL